MSRAPLIHVAGPRLVAGSHRPESGTLIQSCRRCGVPLAYEGQGVGPYPLGALIEIGVGYQALRLSASLTPTCQETIQEVL